MSVQFSSNFHTFSSYSNHFQTDAMMNHSTDVDLVDINTETMNDKGILLGKRKRTLDDDYSTRRTKQLITEEKMTNALRNLNFLEQEDKKPNERVNFIDTLSDECFEEDSIGNQGNENEDGDESQRIILSDEIKESLRKSQTNRDLDYIASKLSEQSKLQLVIWDPKVNISEQIKNNLKKLIENQKKTISDDESCPNQYTVEEPKEYDFFKRSLKRSYEESNRILIEEIENSSSDSSNNSPKNYIVDEPNFNTNSNNSFDSKQNGNDDKTFEFEEMESMDI